MWVTLTQLEVQTCEDFLKGFKGLFNIVVVTAKNPKNFPVGVEVIPDKGAWSHKVTELWEARHSPEVRFASPPPLS